MRKIWIPVLALAAVVLAVYGWVYFYVWGRFEVPQIVGSTVTSHTNDLEQVSEDWFAAFFQQYEGWQVPPDYRIRNARINSVELLEYGCVQINYTVYTAREDSAVVQELGLIWTGTRRIYENQLVVRWEQAADQWQVAESMRPAGYQIAYSPEIRAEREHPEPEHYAIQADAGMTYYIADGTLYVTYDGGESLVEVPDGYDLVCRDENGNYHEKLAYNSCVITPEFTGFIAFSGAWPDEAALLLYSTDGGASWQTERICGGGYWANSFLSRTESGVYATFAVDRALGNDCYATFYSEDFKTWERIEQPGHQSNYTCVYWATDDVGYYPAGNRSVTEELEDGTTRETIKTNEFYLTRDNGASYQLLEYPQDEALVESLGFDPFDTMEKMYREDGIIYLVVGQGDDGDYLEDGVLVSALYRSEDGEHFTLAGHIDNTMKEAG